jgi:hypothetical protein
LSQEDPFGCLGVAAILLGITFLLACLALAIHS